MQPKLVNNKAAREFLLERFAPALADLTVRRVFLTGKSPYPDFPVINLPQTRIVMPLSGRKHLHFASDGEIRDEMLLPGDLLYSEKNGWALPVWDTPVTMLSVAFAEDNSYVRLLYIDNDATVEQYGPDVWYHTENGLDGAGAHLEQSLNLLSRQPGAGALPQTGLLVRALLHMAFDALHQDRPHRQSKAQRTFAIARQYLVENCGHPINRDSVAEALGLSPGYLSALFQRHAGENFNEVLTAMRLRRAAVMLGAPRMSVEATARQCGFADTGYFIKRFRRAYGVTPGKFVARQDDEE